MQRPIEHQAAFGTPYSKGKTFGCRSFVPPGTAAWRAHVSKSPGCDFCPMMILPFCIAGLWRQDAAVGEAFTMLTCEPGPDIAPYHGRQAAVLTRENWLRWLDPAVPSGELIRPLPAGTLAVEQVN